MGRARERAPLCSGPVQDPLEVFQGDIEVVTVWPEDGTRKPHLRRGSLLAKEGA